MGTRSGDNKMPDYGGSKPPKFSRILLVSGSTHIAGSVAGAGINRHFDLCIDLSFGFVASGFVQIQGLHIFGLYFS